MYVEMEETPGKKLIRWPIWNFMLFFHLLHSSHLC